MNKELYTQDLMTADFKKIQLAFLTLQDISEEYFRVDSAFRSHDLFRAAVRFLIAVQDDPVNFVVSPVEKQIFSLFDISLVTVLKDTLVTLVSGNYTNLSSSEEEKKMVDDEETQIKQSIEKIGLNTEQFSKVFSSAAIEDRVKILHALGDVQINIHGILAQAACVNGVINGANSLNTLPTVPQTLENLDKMSDHDLQQIQEIVYGLYALSKSEDRLILSRNLINKWLTKYQESYSFTPLESIIVGLTIHIAFSSFVRLSEDEQMNLLEFYFLKALAFGVPVYDYLAEFLFETETPVLYTIRTALLYSGLNNNKELFPSADDQMISWIVMAKDMSTVDVTHFNSNTLRKALEDYDEIKQKILIESFIIYRKIKDGSLIENNSGGELSSDELYHNELVQLLVLFGFGEDGMNDIEHYFLQTSFAVPLSSFIRELKEVVDLSDDMNVDSILAFTECMRKNAWINDEKELITFDESSSQFHWNQDFVI